MGDNSSSLHADNRQRIEGVELDPLTAAEALRRAARITRDDGYNYAPRSSRRDELLRQALQLDAIASMFPQLIADAAQWHRHRAKQKSLALSASEKEGGFHGHPTDQNPGKGVL